MAGSSYAARCHASTLPSMMACEPPLDPIGYIACAASPTSVTRPSPHRESGSRSTIGYSHTPGAPEMSAGTSSQPKSQPAKWGSTSSARAARFQSAGSTLASSPRRTSATQFTRARELGGRDARRGEGVAQAQLDQLLRGEQEDVDADPERADLGCGFDDLDVNAGRMEAAHFHLKASAGRHADLTTMVFVEGDVYLDDDAIDAVKDSLVVTLDRHEGSERGLSKPFATCHFDVALVPRG